MVWHIVITKLFNVLNYEIVYLREKNLQKISTQEKRRGYNAVAAKGTREAEYPCGQTAGHCI